jgi:hypothetical protein
MTWWRKKCVFLAIKLAKHRDKYTCQRCFKVVGGVNCQWSHVIPESGNKLLSCDPLNIKVLCYKCHKGWRHLHPTESGQWFKDTFPERWEYLHKIDIESNGSIWVEYFKQQSATLKAECIRLGIAITR